MTKQKSYIGGRAVRQLFYADGVRVGMTPRRLFPFALVGIVLIALSPGCGADGPHMTNTTNVQSSWMRNAFQKHEVRVYEAGANQIQFRTDGNFLPADFTVALRQAFRGPPDEHSSIVFLVSRMRDDGVTLEYTSRFDARPFGKDEITMDRGSFVLPWQTP